MELYLIRHAHALALGERGITNDEERPLSEEGEEQAVAAAKALAQRGVVLDKFYTSPLVRARRTAEIMVETWGKPELILENCDALTPDSKMRKLSKFLLRSGADKVGLVGHMPHLGEFAGWLLGSKTVDIDFAKAGIALIPCELPSKGMGGLHWLVSPEWY